MASDWIKVRCGLRKTSQVKGIAARLQLSPRDVVGRLVDVWSLGDAYAVARDSLSRFCPGEGGTNVPDIEGFLSHYTFADIDEEAGQLGFALAMQEEGWLDSYANGIAFPEWDQHHSKSAKERACEQKRKRNHRRLSGSERDKCPGDAGTETGTVEKRREEKSNTTPIVPKGTDAYPSVFESWWNQYPKHIRTNKRAAFKAYKQAGKVLVARGMSKQQAADFLLMKVSEFSKSPRGLRTDLSLNPSTWLNGGKYDDEPAAWQSNGQEKSQYKDQEAVYERL